MFYHRVTIATRMQAPWQAIHCITKTKSNFDKIMHIFLPSAYYLKKLNSVQQTVKNIKIIYAYDYCYIRYLRSNILLLIT